MHIINVLQLMRHSDICSIVMRHIIHSPCNQKNVQLSWADGHNICITKCWLTQEHPWSMHNIRKHKAGTLAAALPANSPVDSEAAPDAAIGQRNMSCAASADRRDTFQLSQTLEQDSDERIPGE